MRKRTTLTIGVAAVVMASGAGWLVGRNIRSPAEIAARTAPPPASLITVPVELRTLVSEVVTRGTVRFGTPQTVTLPTSALKTGSQVVTVPPEKGASLDEGDVAMVISGRPVFVLSGAQPAYRDLRPGSTGDDVRQLEESLLRLGFDPGPVDGVFDVGAEFAVAAWYDSKGWTVPGPTDEQLLALRVAQTDRFTLESELLLSREALATARLNLTIATEKARAARIAADGAPAAEAAAKANALLQKATADADVVAKNSALTAAVDSERVARLTRDEALLADPPVQGAALETLQAALRAATDAVAVARTNLTAAEAAAAAVVTPVPGVLTAELNRIAASAAAEQTQAGEAVTVAKSRVDLITERVTALDDNLSRLSGTMGVQVPADELLFFPNLPLQVDSVAVKIGEQVAGPTMTVTNFTLAVDASLTVNDAKLVAVGAPATINQPDLAITTDGTVTAVATTPGTKGVDPQRFYLEVTPANAPASLVGTSVVVTVTVTSTDGDVLAVPVAALSMAADGTSRVQVQGDDQVTRFVTVTPGLAASGFVAVTPEGDLEEGDLVVVGATNNEAQGDP